jgi:hypothetical protein
MSIPRGKVSLEGTQNNCLPSVYGFETSDFFCFLARISNQKRSFTCYPEMAMACAREMSHNSARESALQLSRRSSAIAIRLESGENAPFLASTAGAGNSSSPVSRYQRRALSQPDVTTIFGGGRSHRCSVQTGAARGRHAGAVSRLPQMQKRGD